MTREHIEFVLSEYSTGALPGKLLELFDEEAASYQHTINELNKALSKNKGFDGMTNGEVIQTLFPNISVYEHGSTYSVNNEYNFNATWWNAPYEKECIKTLPTVEKESCRCNTCVNSDDEFSGECYECLKGMFDHYEKKRR